MMRVQAAGGLQITGEGADLVVGAVGSVSVPDGAPVESRREDGTLWRRHWHEPDRLVIDFVGAAMVEVRSSTLTFDRQLPAEAEEHIVLDHVLPLWLAWRGSLVVHAGLVAARLRGVALIGPSGAGKSTLTARLAQLGWSLGGDDGIVITGSAPPLAEATYSSIRLTDRSIELLGESDHTPIAGKHRLGTNSMTVLDGPIELALLAFVEPADETSIEEMRPAVAHARLFGSTFHSDLDPDRSLPVAFETVASVVESVRAVTLRVGRGIAGLDTAAKHLDALVVSG